MKIVFCTYPLALAALLFFGMIFTPGSAFALGSESAASANPDWMQEDLSYLGRPRPGLTPERFPPDSLLANSSWWWHSAPTFSPDLTEMHWTKFSIYPTSWKTELVNMKIINGQWSAVQYSSFGNLSYRENNPFFSASNDTLYFYSERPGGRRFRTTRTPTGWSVSTAVNVPSVAGTTNGLQFFIARNGAMYIDLWRNSQLDLYKSELVGGVYQMPVQQTIFNSTSNDFCPYLDPQERFIIFVSNRPGGYGAHDLYISIKDAQGMWGTPVNLGATVNSSAEECWPYISPDGLYFFYVTSRAGDNGDNPYWMDAKFIYDLLIDTTATMLQSMEIECVEDCIVVTWALSTIDKGVVFEVLRATGDSRGFAPLSSAELERNGLTFTMRDAAIEPGASYHYRVQYGDAGDKRILFETDAVSVPPLSLKLHQNRPNPFNPTTTIAYDLPKRCIVTISIYDVEGSFVRTLVHGEAPGGRNEVLWDGLDSRGQPVSSGLYFCRLRAEKTFVSRKMVLLR